jgi:hypothetical protein
MDLNTHETMKLLTAEERERFVAFQSMFESDGWRLLMQYTTAKYNAAVLRGANASSWEDNRQAAGYRDAWAEVSNMETQFMNEFAAIADERRGDATVEPEFEEVEE